MCVQNRVFKKGKKKGGKNCNFFFFFTRYILNAEENSSARKYSIPFSPLRRETVLFISGNLLGETRVYRLPIVRLAKIDIPLMDFFANSLNSRRS